MGGPEPAEREGTAVRAEPAVRAGRPRDPDVADRVREATLRLLVERGYPALRIDDVARASGVAKTTVYLRWPSLALLVLDAVEAALGPRVLTPSDDVEADLVALLQLVHRSLVDNPIGWSLPGIGLDLMREPELAEQYRSRFIAPVREQAVALIGRGTAQGRFRPVTAPEDVFDCLAGSFVYRRLMGAPPPSLAALVAMARAALGLPRD